MGKEPFCKVPLSVFKAALSLPKTSQQDKLLAAYVRVFFTDDPGEVPANIRPVFEVVKGTADSIKKARLDGASGWATRIEKAANDSQAIIEEHANDSRSNIGQVDNNATTSRASTQPYIPPYAPITNTTTNTTANTKRDEAPGVGVALEPPTREAIESLKRDINDPDRVRAFIEHGNAMGWDIPGYQRYGIVPAYLAWSTEAEG